jgi:hypothetical protein
MDLRSLCNSVSTVINPNVVGDVYVSTGWTKDPLTLRQIPGYAAPVTGPIQIQALDGEDLKQLDGLNLQGVIKAAYLRGVLAGVIRPDSTGGDKIVLAGKTWLVVKVIEGWATWTKVAIVLQSP